MFEECDEAMRWSVIGGSIATDVSGVSGGGISEFLLLRRIPSSLIWLILVGEAIRSVEIVVSR